MSHETINKYNEPWDIAGSTNNRVWDANGNAVVKTIINENGYSRDEDESRAERIVNLINLFAGVPDEVIEEMSTKMEIPRYALAIQTLIHPLEDVPLASLIDELQETPQFQKQTECYKSYRELFDCLTDQLATISEAIERVTAKGVSVDDTLIRGSYLLSCMRILKNRITKLITPVGSDIQTTRKPTEKQGILCYHCTSGLLQTDYEDTINNGCRVCKGTGRI